MQSRGGQAQIRGNIPIPSDGTTSSHNIKEDGNAIRTNGERHSVPEDMTEMTCMTTHHNFQEKGGNFTLPRPVNLEDISKT
jgi:hypothetical protein